MQRRLVLLALALPLGLAGAAWGGGRQADTVTQTTFVITGHGYGHGVGMGQWGAYAMASQGATYDRILSFYYPGTKLAPSPVTSLRVLLADTAKPVTVWSQEPFRVRDGTGAVRPVASGELTVDPSLRVQLAAADPPTVLPGPLTLLPGGAPLVVGRPYRGRIQLQVVGGRLQVVDVVGLDDYVRGVVTREMPKQWPLEALKAQAVAARSYAVATQQAGKIVYGDVRSEAYGGVEGESPAALQAVAATKNQVLVYGGQVATTYFSASSGGRTAALTDVIPNAKPVPYLVAANDPYDAASPWHDWGPVVLGAAKLSAKLRVPGVTAVTPVPATGHAREIVLTTPTGQKTLGAGVLRTALGLRSTFVKIGTLTLGRPAGTATPGATVTLTGAVRGVKGAVMLESSTGGGAWSPGPEIRLAEDGSFSVEVTPAATTRYRLAVGTVRSTPLVVAVDAPGGSRSLSAAAPAATAFRASSGLFAPDDPLVSRQWYLEQDRAFDYWPVLPSLPPVLVGLVDTGIDAGHPEFAGRIAAAKSFVGGSVDDQLGHGTFVAGEIAAVAGNGIGIAGIGLPAQLVVAKVVGADGTIDPAVEARAIRWEVDRGVRVINLSIGAVRDPNDPNVDTYSPVEAAAVQYAVAHDVLLVAAVGNGDDAPSRPWPYASYPAALPHVLGVSALAPDGSVPVFSNRDPLYDDVAAPGENILSTFPRSLTALRPSCADQGYSDCGTRDYRDGDGTSFAAPQVTAAAALLFSVRPSLTASQAATLIERTADDVNPATGCSQCSIGRDALSGWGSLDILAALRALDGPLPAPDRLEPNDDAGPLAPRIWGSSSVVRATLDYWDDPIDVYRVKLAAGQTAAVSVHAAKADGVRLVLWKPGTKHVTGSPQLLRSRRLVESRRSGRTQSFTYRAAAAGWYDLEVQLTRPGSGPYTLRVAKTD